MCLALKRAIAFRFWPHHRFQPTPAVRRFVSFMLPLFTALMSHSRTQIWFLERCGHPNACLYHRLRSEHIARPYYGPHGTIPSISYSEVTNQPAGFFRGKWVFVGARPKTLYAFEDPEEFRTPHSRWGGGTSPGVEIMATQFLNLQRGIGSRAWPDGRNCACCQAAGWSLALGWALRSRGWPSRSRCSARRASLSPRG